MTKGETGARQVNGGSPSHRHLNQDADLRIDAIALGGRAPIKFAQTGTGRDVILIHGALSSLDDMAIGLFPSLEDRFRVTAFDRPGHGESGKDGVTGSCWLQARKLHGAARALGLTRPILVGHSFGGAVALAYALQFPEDTAGVVCLAPIAFPEVRLEHFVFGPRGLGSGGAAWNALTSSLLDPILLPVLWRGMFYPQPISDRFARAFPFHTAAQTSRTRADGEDSLSLNLGLVLNAMNYASCAVPVRVLAGDADIVVNNELHGRVLAAAVPDGAYRELPGLGHMLHHFAPSAVREVLETLSD